MPNNVSGKLQIKSYAEMIVERMVTITIFPNKLRRGMGNNLFIKYNGQFIHRYRWLHLMKAIKKI